MNNFDVIICGAGAAGLYGAYNLSRDLNVLVIAKRELTLCNSSLAQGGIAGVYRSPADSPKSISTILLWQAALKTTPPLPMCW